MPRSSPHPELAPHTEAAATCTFCPNLCRHVCPVEAVDGRDSVSPWGLMSLLGHVAGGRLALDADVAQRFETCSTCGACTEFCVHSVDVPGALVDARRASARLGLSTVPVEQLLDREVPGAADAEDEARHDDRFERVPELLVFPGAGGEAEEAAKALCRVVERLEDDELAFGAASRLDPGHALWAAGHKDAFVRRARRVAQALEGVRTVVVTSMDALYTLRVLYPAHGISVRATLLHATELLAPRLGGASVTRVPGRVAVHAPCSLRQLPGLTAPDEVLARVLADDPIPLTWSGPDARCCGGSRAFTAACPSHAAAMAEAVVEDALRRGAERLVSVGPGCVEALRGAAGQRLVVEELLAVVDRAVRGPNA